MTPENSDIAIIGMACRVPGARDLDQFWENLAAGVESIAPLSDEDRRASGIDRATWTREGYVRAAPLLDDYDKFDAAFFGYSPAEARLLDPQQRVFLECAWTALEHAGYDASHYPGAIGVYGGAALNTYWLATGAARRLRDTYVLTLIGNDKDFLTSRVSYKLGLSGPSVCVQTACSTSLVAVHLACQSLLGGECDMALAGGVAVRVPQRAGYQYESDGPFSPDGHCRAFDARAMGTLFGSGVGIVVLKPLAEALADGDRIFALIKGTAVNNDGASKVDYAAPSVTGQAEVVAEALAHAGVEAAAISYVEAHGTGTALGDPVEITALTKAFRRTAGGRSYCAIGSVKSNLGHLDAAAGVTGLIKTVLALGHGRIPPSLHFDQPNPRIDFPSTPFYVNTTLSEWEGPRPRRAGVSSLGIGGTNAHVVLEEAPPPAPAADSRPFQLLVLSAKTEVALESVTRNLSLFLARNPATNLADVAHTLRVGRKALRHRRTVVCGHVGDAVRNLEQLPAQRVHTAVAEPKARPVVFLFPGGGSKQPPAVMDLHAEPVFREAIQRGVDELRRLDDYDFGRVLLEGGEVPKEDYARPTIQLPILYVIEEALAALWMSWGVTPSALIGHSMGEVTAARLAGVFTLAEALHVVMTRARLAEKTPRGAMLSVFLPEAELAPLLGPELDLAGVNTPETCVVSGSVPAIDELTRRLAEQKVEAARVPVDSAGHSSLFDPFLVEFEREVARCALAPPRIPFISNLTGTWITDAQATDPSYWARQYRRTVRFADGVRELMGNPDRLFLEVGPGQTLGTFLRSQRSAALPSLPMPAVSGSNVASLLEAAGQLWLAGAELDWHGLTAHERRQRVPLPTYPFARERHWFEDEEEPLPWADRLKSAVRLGVSLARRAVGRTPNGNGHASTFVRAPATSAPGFVGPRTPTEQAVAQIWRDVLGSREVSIHADFFQLGGNSLLLSQVMSRVNQKFRTQLSVLTLIESATIAELAECVDAVRRQVS